MIDKENRREFIRKIGLFSGIYLTGINTAFSENLLFKTSDGIVIKANEGEVWYIGNERKAEVNIKISKSSNYTPEMSLLTEKVNPGDGIPVHRHLNEEEFIFIQKGKLEITLGNKTQDGETGDIIYVPKDCWHGFQNISNKESEIFLGYSPAGFEDYFRAIGTKSINDNLGFTAEDWVKTNKKYGVVYRR